MSNSNYPAGVSDSHPYFNPPRETATEVECGNEEALVVPAHAIRGQLQELVTMIQNLHGVPWEVTVGMSGKAQQILDQIDELERGAEYECPFHAEIDLEESECARWTCPVCGEERETDTMPEERDPDEAWDSRHDD